MMRNKKGQRGTFLALCPFLSPESLMNHIQLETLAAGLILKTVFPPEFLHAACRVHKLLLARKKRMALGADLHMDFLHCRAGLKDVAAGAGDRCGFVLRMDAFFHKPLLHWLIA